MKTWLKRYAITCLVATFVFAVIDGYTRPGQDMRFGAILVTAAVWPVFTTLVVGSAIGEVASKQTS